MFLLRWLLLSHSLYLLCSPIRCHSLVGYFDGYMNASIGLFLVRMVLIMNNLPLEQLITETKPNILPTDLRLQLQDQAMQNAYLNKLVEQADLMEQIEYLEMRRRYPYTDYSRGPAEVHKRAGSGHGFVGDPKLLNGNRRYMNEAHKQHYGRDLNL